jgi:hypothetical protein
MVETVFVGYLSTPFPRQPSGLRVLTDGHVERFDGKRSWNYVISLKPEQMERLKNYVLDSGLLQAPAEVPAPEGMRDGTKCEWEVNLEGQTVQVTFHGWSDHNLPARPSRKLALQMSELISEALIASRQAG